MKIPFPLHWHTEPLLLGALILVGWVYAMATGPLRHWFALREPYPLRFALAFYAGLTCLYLAVGSPLDQLGEDFLFSAHMVQHMLLIYVAPPLFLAGIPTWLIDTLITSSRTAHRILRVLTRPLWAGALFSFFFALWHVPVLYERALQNKSLHILEHYLMFFPALLIWWPLLSPSKKLPSLYYGIRIIYVFVLMVAQIPLFGFLTLSRSILYPTYEFSPRILPALSALNDQVLGGLIMKVTNMIVSLSIIAVVFIKWSQQDESKG